MHINPIASIRRVVLGPARHEDVPACHGSCLGLIKDLSCQQTGHNVPIVPKNLNPTQHEAREGRAGSARHGPSPSSMVRVHLVAQATKVKLPLSFDIEPSMIRLISLHFYFNSHIVFGGEHTHRRSIHWHLVHLLICLTFLLPQVHQALCTYFSSMLPEMEGIFPAFVSYEFASNYLTGMILLDDTHFPGGKQIHCSVQ